MQFTVQLHVRFTAILHGFFLKRCSHFLYVFSCSVDYLLSKFFFLFYSSPSIFVSAFFLLFLSCSFSLSPFRLSLACVSPSFFLSLFFKTIWAFLRDNAIGNFFSSSWNGFTLAWFRNRVFFNAVRDTTVCQR